MTIVVTAATGNVGRPLVTALARAGTQHRHSRRAKATRRIHQTNSPQQQRNSQK